LISTGVGSVRPASSQLRRIVLPGVAFLTVAWLPSAFRQWPPSSIFASWRGPNQRSSAAAVAKAP